MGCARREEREQGCVSSWQARSAALIPPALFLLVSERHYTVAQSSARKRRARNADVACTSRRRCPTSQATEKNFSCHSPLSSLSSPRSTCLAPFTLHQRALPVSTAVQSAALWLSCARASGRKHRGRGEEEEEDLSLSLFLLQLLLFDVAGGDRATRAERHRAPSLKTMRQ